MENMRAITHFWTEEQTTFMLNVLKELNILKFLDGRKTRNGELFKKVSLKMVEAGFHRTPEQIRIRWKNVKKAFFQAKRDNGASGRGRTTCPFYELLDDLLGSRPLSRVEHNGVDSGVQLPTTVDWKEDMARSEAREELLIASILRTDSMLEKMMMQRTENNQPNALSPPPQPPQDSFYGYGFPSYHQLN
ncbi:Zinc finger protein with KRAB and SCAN domains 2 [Liparis tanakae]|uniref:Zinc finger protein with KRAB and SCAN domains 2 n=1 Tax=Liparis tanakae TaxID=230148 RepID=A0A4Z2INM0_9TELE|nr:Zinc finger protein with KRAB and SCAN domains 2 [Liparis tanakae]